VSRGFFVPDGVAAAREVAADASRRPGYIKVGEIVSLFGRREGA